MHLAMPSPPVAPLPVNQVLLGDCNEELARLPGECADLVFADPPYFLQLKDPLRRPNRTLVYGVHSEWDKFSSLAEYDEFTRARLAGVRRIMKPQATLFIIDSYRFLDLERHHLAQSQSNAEFSGRRFTNAR